MIRIQVWIQNIKKCSGGAAIFWQCSPGTVETQRLYPLRHGPWRAIKDGFFGLINPYLVFQSRVRTEFLYLSLIGIILRWGFLIWELIFYLLRTFCPHLDRFFLCCFFFHYVSAKFHLWPSSGDLPQPRIGMLSLVTVSPVITAFHSCCLLHYVFDQVNLWPAWVGFETAIFWQCSPGTVETQRLYPLRHGPRRAIKDGFLVL